MRKTTGTITRILGLAALVLAVAAPVAAVVVPEPVGVRANEFRHPDLDISDGNRALAQVPGDAASMAGADLAALGVPADRARLDVRGGRFGVITPSQPLVPGRGVGNELRWDDLGTAPPANEAALRVAAGQAFRGYLAANSAQLRIDVGELAGNGHVTVYKNGAVVQIHQPRVFNGIPVRDSYLTGGINNGNLVLFGAHQWGDIELSTVPGIPVETALATVQTHIEPFGIVGAWGKSELVIVPTAAGPNPDAIPVGRGYGHRLAWVVRPSVENDMGSWEGLVDAHTGELISFEDQNRYATTREVKGGVYPETNDGVGPEGTEQAGWPMPFANVDNAGNTYTTDEGGNLLQCLDGTIATQLVGPYMLMNDNCGAINESTTGPVLDLGFSGGTDCTVPPGASPGNTHSSRSGFYEMNRIKEMARGQLPANSWLQQQLQANMNINNTCNAFWNGTVNFYRFGGGCNNTGELAGVFDHEWGHGMDANDATPGVSNPGEGIADAYAALRLGTSCIGRGFFLGSNCGGYGDPCTQCDGIRDIDFANRASGQPHDFTWANANCGGGVHCRGYVYSEAIWDLWKRDLPAVYGMDNNTALEVTTRLTYIGAGGVGTWYSGSPPFGGCAATSGYQQFLVADDDNGNINDGTPHMQAIFDAFNRHEIACGTPTVADTGCAGTPTTAPAVTATALDRGADLSWGAVAGATEYEIFRTDGVFACDFGKTKVGSTTGTSFSDSGLQNGRDYYYTVIAKGPSDSCFGPASACTTVTPVAGANLQLDVASAATVINTGDADDFVDNCETATVSFDVINVGTAQTNVRIDAVRAVSHPGITIDSINAVSPSALAACATGSGSFDFTAGGLFFGDTIVFEVDVTSDELSPIVKTATLTLENAESDLNFVASQTWDFESTLDGWTLIQGTFNQTTTGGGANGSSGYVASSAFLDNQCDQVRSPAFRLTASSTLTLWNNYEIENFSGQWWDRANVAFFEGGARNSVDPDSGRLYNASGAGATCVTVGQNGWANVNNTWGSSGWSATALDSAGRAGQTVQLDVAYGTDVSVNGKGFWFDQVTLTDVEFLVADAQSDTCTPECTVDADCDDGLFCNGVETCSGGSCQAGSDPCPGQGCDEVGDVCVPCDNDGTCEAGEDCNSCPGDCIGGTTSGASCGNGLCEAGDGEDCVSCPADCNGLQSGKKSNRFCCGDGDGQNPLPCSNATCSTGGWSCTDTPQPPTSYCCGDNVCEGAEDSTSCEVDCGSACVPTPGQETQETSCTDGIDNDCDGFTDGADSDCQVCNLGQPGDPCTTGAECCSGNCKGKPGAKKCK